MTDHDNVSYPAVTGSARWLTSDAAGLLRSGGVARLEVRTPKLVKRRGSLHEEGERVVVYRVQSVDRDGQRVAWRLSRDDETSGEVLTYTINIGSSGLPESCNCRDATHRARVGGCR